MSPLEPPMNPVLSRFPLEATAIAGTKPKPNLGFARMISRAERSKVEAALACEAAVTLELFVGPRPGVEVDVGRDVLRRPEG